MISCYCFHGLGPEEEDTASFHAPRFWQLAPRCIYNSISNLTPHYYSDVIYGAVGMPELVPLHPVCCMSESQSNGPPNCHPNPRQCVSKRVGVLLHWGVCSAATQPHVVDLLLSWFQIIASALATGMVNIGIKRKSTLTLSDCRSLLLSWACQFSNTVFASWHATGNWNGPTHSPTLRTWVAFRCVLPFIRWRSQTPKGTTLGALLTYTQAQPQEPGWWQLPSTTHVWWFGPATV